IAAHLALAFQDANVHLHSEAEYVVPPPPPPPVAPMPPPTAQQVLDRMPPPPHCSVDEWRATAVSVRLTCISADHDMLALMAGLGGLPAVYQRWLADWPYCTPALLAQVSDAERDAAPAVMRHI